MYHILVLYRALYRVSYPVCPAYLVLYSVLYTYFTRLLEVLACEIDRAT